MEMNRGGESPARGDSPPVEEFIDPAGQDAWQELVDSGVASIAQGYVLCLELAGLHRTGIAAQLLAPEGFTPSIWEGDSPRRGDVAVGLLRHLEVRGVVREQRGTYRATASGRGLLSPTAWALLGFYQEAYGPVLDRAGELASGEAAYGVHVERDAAALGRHCETLTRVFNTELLSSLVGDLSIRRVLDLGCGTGGLVLDLCERHPGLHGIGLDIAPEPLKLAEAAAQARGLAGRAEFKVGDAFRPSSWPPECKAADGIIAVGAIHEHFRDGEDAVVSLLRSFRDEMQASRARAFILCEPELVVEPHDADYFLVHVLTEQGMPRPRQGWLPLLAEAGLRCERLLTTPETGFRFAFYVLSPDDAATDTPNSGDA